MLSLILFTLGLARAGENLVLTAERRSPAGLEQVGVVFKGPGQEAAEASANSGFLWPGEKPPRLGRFRLTGPGLGRFSKNWWSRLIHLPADEETPVSWPRNHPEAGRGGPHRLRISVGGVELKPGTYLYERVRAFLMALPRTAKWDDVGGKD